MLDMQKNLIDPLYPISFDKGDINISAIKLKIKYKKSYCKNCIFSGFENLGNQIEVENKIIVSVGIKQ